ncbi:MAG: DUF423 domain-containing protein [Proteobacteria bacterium]|nr:DUF423 domain-containing protein [Pseudomonadota bacterium]
MLLALATLCGALGAHGLREHLTPPHLVTWETAVRYQFYNSLGLLGVAIVRERRDGRALRIVATLLVVGVVLFCGSLYALALGAPRWLGVCTPLGGVAWICAWGTLALGALRAGRHGP